MKLRLHAGALARGLTTSLLVLTPACSGNSAAATSTPSPVAATPTSASPTAAPTATAKPSPVSASSTFVVGNTAGDGAFIRRTPGGETIRAWPDGAEMTAVGEDVQAGGRTWKNVRDAEGNEGWVATEYLMNR